MDHGDGHPEAQYENEPRPCDERDSIGVSDRLQQQPAAAGQGDNRAEGAGVDHDRQAHRAGQYSVGPFRPDGAEGNQSQHPQGIIAAEYEIFVKEKISAGQAHFLPSCERRISTEDKNSCDAYSQMKHLHEDRIAGNSTESVQAQVPEERVTFVSRIFD